MKTKWLWTLTLSLIISLPGLAGAAFITNTGNFGAGTVTEGFEEFSPNPLIPNTSVASYGNFILLGTNAAYDFGNGITLTTPPVDPGNPWPNLGPYVNNTQYANNGDVLGNYGWAAAPYGSAYLSAWRYQTPFSLIFTFASDVQRAGAYFTGLPDDGSTYTVLALDKDGNILAQQAINTVSVADWGTHSMLAILNKLFLINHNIK